MPLWRIFTSPTTFTPAQKSALAKDITALYAVLPAFYVDVVFVPTAPEDLYVGGERHPKFVRIVVEQIARRLPDLETEEGKQRRAYWMGRIEEVLKPHIKDRGDLDWEIHVLETERALWRINGMVPPQQDSDGEKKWKRENKATEYEGGEKSAESL